MSSPTILRSPAGGNELQAAAQIARERFETLSPREAEILALIAEGLPDSGIADRSKLSVRTVEHYVGHILTKLGVENRTAAAACYVRQQYADLLPNPAPTEPRPRAPRSSK